MRLSEALNLHRDEIRRIVESRSATNSRVFGSVLRGADTEESDLDLLVGATPEASLFEIVHNVSASEPTRRPCGCCYPECAPPPHAG